MGGKRKRLTSRSREMTWWVGGMGRSVCKQSESHLSCQEQAHRPNGEKQHNHPKSLRVPWGVPIASYCLLPFPESASLALGLIPLRVELVSPSEALGTMTSGGFLGSAMSITSGCGKEPCSAPLCGPLQTPHLLLAH